MPLFIEDAAYHDMYLRALDSIYDGVAIYEDNGRVLYVNDAHLAQVGVPYTEEDKIEEYLTSLMRGTLQLESPICSDLISKKAITSWKPTSGLVTYYRTQKACLVSSAPLTLPTGRRVIVSVVRDMTELLNLQNKLEASDKLKQSYADQLEELGIIHSTFGLAHIKSKAMVDIYDKARRIADTTAPVLILGETGVGKDFLSRHIHDCSNRKSQPFVKVNCGAIPAQLLESELFGYEAGAFTGANRNGKKGLVEMADQGTLYLDEIGEMPTDLQVKLLGVLQDRQITRVGGTKPKPVSFRLISATNKDLEQCVLNGTFRQDLFYRLNVVTLKIPPLRERREDIFPLVEVFLQEMNNHYKKETYFDPEALEMILHHPWHGNIRELKNIIEQMVVLAIEPRLTSSALTSVLGPQKITPSIPTTTPAASYCSQKTLKQTLDECERDYIRNALSCHSTLREAADSMGIDLSTLVRKKKKHAL